MWRQAAQNWGAQEENHWRTGGGKTTVVSIPTVLQPCLHNIFTFLLVCDAIHNLTHHRYEFEKMMVSLTSQFRDAHQIYVSGVLYIMCSFGGVVNGSIIVFFPNDMTFESSSRTSVLEKKWRSYINKRPTFLMKVSPLPLIKRIIYIINSMSVQHPHMLYILMALYWSDVTLWVSNRHK